MPQIIAGWLFAAGIGTTLAFGAVTWAAVAGYVIYSALTYVALKALMGDAGAGMTSSGILTNGVNPTAPHRFIYGQQRVGGTVTYEEATDDNKYLHMMICLAGHEVEEIGQIYINDEAVTLDGSGFVTSHDWSSKIRILKHLGADDQVADATFQSETENAAINSTFRAQGIAYLYVRVEYDRDVLAQGIPLFTAVVKGRKVLDPRTGVTAYSANAALCIRDYVAGDFGIGATSGEFDDTLWSAEADVCDEAVALDGGGTEPRYEINGSFTLDMPPKDIVPRLLTACAGTFFWSQGEFILKTGYYSTPVKTFDESHLRGGIQVDPRVSIRDNFNTIRGTFMDAGQKWITVDFPEITGAAFVAEDNGEENAIDLPLPFTTSGAMAQRLAKVTLYRNREQITFTSTFSLEAYTVQVGDNVNITNDQMGFASKPFEVQAWQLVYEKGRAITVKMTLREISAAVFSWAAEESDIIGNETILPSRAFFYNIQRFDITVATLPADAAAAKVAFQINIGGPIDGDTVVFTTRSGAEALTQSIWEYDGATGTWVVRSNDFDGVHIIDGTVDTLILADGSVEEVKLGVDAVTGTKIAPNAVDTVHIVNEAITAAEIAAAAVIAGKIGTDAVAEANIIDLAVGSAKIAALAVTSAKIAAASITAAKIGVAAIETAHISNLAVVSASIGDLEVGTIKIGAEAVTGQESTINSVAWTDSGAYGTTWQLIGEITYLVDSDDQLAVERLLVEGSYRNYTHLIGQPLSGGTTIIQAESRMEIFKRDGGGDTLIGTSFRNWLVQAWTPPNLIVVPAAYNPRHSFGIVKNPATGGSFDAGDTIVVKFSHRQQRSGSTGATFTITVADLQASWTEYKR